MFKILTNAVELVAAKAPSLNLDSNTLDSMGFKVLKNGHTPHKKLLVFHMVKVTLPLMVSKDCQKMIIGQLNII